MASFIQLIVLSAHQIKHQSATRRRIRHLRLLQDNHKLCKKRSHERESYVWFYVEGDKG